MPEQTTTVRGRGYFLDDNNELIPLRINAVEAINTIRGITREDVLNFQRHNAEQVGQTLRQAVQQAQVETIDAPEPALRINGAFAQTRNEAPANRNTAYREMFTRVEAEAEYKKRSKPQLEALAEKRGCECVWGTDKQLLIDIDDREYKTERFYELMRQIQEIVGYEPDVQSWESRHGGMHIVVTLHESYDAPTRLALECALGSDPKRALLTWQRLRDGEDPLHVLFRPLVKETPHAE